MAIEFAVINLIIIAFIASSQLSNRVIFCLIIIGVILFSLYYILRMHTYKVVIKKGSIGIFNFKLGFTPKKQEIFYNDIDVTYMKELVGKGIKQKQIRIFEKNELKVILKPSLTGWQHDVLDQIIADLISKNVIVRIE